MITHHVRIGFSPEVFRATHDRQLPRGCEVLVRTPRGVELGNVLSSFSPPAGAPTTTLRIVRPVDGNDRRLIERLTRHKVRAVQECQRLLAEKGSQVQLLDVDQLIDGGTLILHFLGEPQSIDRELTDAIVRQYESEVRSIELSDLMEAGCGEGCGTSSSGCGGGCASCAVGCAASAVKAASQSRSQAG